VTARDQIVRGARRKAGKPNRLCRRSSSRPLTPIRFPRSSELSDFPYGRRSPSAPGRWRYFLRGNNSTPSDLFMGGDRYAETSARRASARGTRVLEDRPGASSARYGELYFGFGGTWSGKHIPQRSMGIAPLSMKPLPMRPSRLFRSDPLTNRAGNRESLHRLPWKNTDGKAAGNAAASLKFSEISASPTGRSELVILNAKWQFCLAYRERNLPWLH